MAGWAAWRPAVILSAVDGSHRDPQDGSAQPRLRRTGDPSAARDPGRLAGPTPSSVLRAATSSLAANKTWAPGVSAETLNRVERAGSCAGHQICCADGRTAALVPVAAGRTAQLGDAGRPGRHLRLRGLGPLARHRIPDHRRGVRQRPRDLVRAVSLRRTVELVRIAITVAEEDLPSLAVDAAETIALRDSLLRYSREVAFAAASVYAAAAETRGAWDARVEAAVVDGVVRGRGLRLAVVPGGGAGLGSDRRHAGDRRRCADRRSGRRGRRGRGVGVIGRPGGDVRGARRPAGAGAGRERAARHGDRGVVRRRPGGPWPAGRRTPGGGDLGRRRPGRPGCRRRPGRRHRGPSTPTTC